MIKSETWYREASQSDVLQHLSDPVPFDQLPPEYQASIQEYISDGVPEEVRPEHLAKYLFRYGEVPTELLASEISRVQGERGEIDMDFEKYHRWYVEERERNWMPDHGPDNRWPVTLSPYYEEEVLEDGWHRFHDYYRKEHSTIPVVQFIKKS